MASTRILHHVLIPSAAFAAAPIRRAVGRVNLSPVLAQPLAPITFPTTRLRCKALIALGANPSADPSTWLWEDISGYIRYADGISTALGRKDESGTVTPGKASLRLKNGDGRFSRRNPLSPYYGLLSRNTPIRLSADPGDGDHIRFEGFVNEWPTRWVTVRPSGDDSTVPIVCSGILRQLASRGGIRSTLYRAILASSPIAYWHCEDGVNSNQAASALSGGSDMKATGTVVFHANSDVVGSHPLPTLNGGSLRGTVSGGSSTSWSIEFVGSFADGFYLPAAWTASGSLNDWQFAQLGTGDARLFAYDGSTQLTPIFFDPRPYDEPHHWVVTATQNGANVDCTVRMDGVQIGSGTVTTQTAGRVTSASLNGAGSAFDMSLGHLAVFNGVQTGHYTAFTGNTGEQAHVRMARICDEAGIAFTTLASESTALGPQPRDNVLPILRDAEKADMGVLYENGFGLGYQARSERYNAPVGLALDFDQGHIAEPPEPDDDDQKFRNRWTVNRADGSSATFEDTASVDAIGPVEDEITINVDTDEQLANQAAQRVHISGVDEDRWPSLSLQLAASPELIQDWTALGYGPRVTASNPPDQVAPDTIDAFVEGHSERWDQFLWSVELNTTPASPYRVGVYDTGHYDTAGSELAAAFVTGTDTSMSVATTLGPVWTTTAADFPFDIACGGAVLTVTSITGGSSPQTFTVTQTPVNGVSKTIAAGTPLSLARPSIYAL